MSSRRQSLPSVGQAGLDPLRSPISCSSSNSLAASAMRVAGRRRRGRRRIGRSSSDASPPFSSALHHVARNSRRACAIIDLVEFAVARRAPDRQRSARCLCTVSVSRLKPCQQLRVGVEQFGQRVALAALHLVRAGLPSRANPSSASSVIGAGLLGGFLKRPQAFHAIRRRARPAFPVRETDP